MAVLPVWRSPMINSRWPLPIGTIESMALIPVCKGCLTGWRSMIPGATISSGIFLSGCRAPLPSSAWPSGLTTRPMISAPTGMLITSPVRFTTPPSLTCVSGPINTQPTLSYSKFIAIPLTPLPKSTSSEALTLFNPWTRAMPSPTWMTVPTSLTSTDVLKCSIFSFDCHSIPVILLILPANGPVAAANCRLPIPRYTKF